MYVTFFQCTPFKMINESNIVCLEFYSNKFMFINLVLYISFFIYLFKTASLMFLSYILFELLDVEHGSPISHKNVKCNSLGLSLAIVPLPSRGNFVHYDFQILHYISHKTKYVSSLRETALACNIMLRTLPRKIT